MIEEFVWEKTTPIEFFVSGVLVLLALTICVASFFLEEIKEIFSYLNHYQSISTGVLFSTIFVAIAYMVGVFSESIVREIFELQFDGIRINCVKEYLKNLKDDNLSLEKSPILKKLEGVDPSEITKWQARYCLGFMRSHVLMKSPALYQDIELQLHRFRLIRILFLVELILIVAMIGHLYQDFSLLFIFALIFLVIIAVRTFMMIYDRFKRYCRAIERSYIMLTFDQDTDVQHVLVLQVNIW